MKVYFCMGWLSLVGLSIAKHAGSKGDLHLRLSGRENAVFLSRFQVHNINVHGWQSVPVPAQRLFSLLVLEAEARVIMLTLHLPACFSVLFSQYLWICWPVLSGGR